jgi:hypothetical protein
MSEHDNPVITQGLVLTREEYEVVSSALAVISDQASQLGRPKIHRVLQDVLGRLKHHTFAGDGAPPTIMSVYERNLAKAIRAKDLEGMQGHVRAMIAAHVRMSPDPARAVAESVVGILANEVLVLALQDAQVQAAMREGIGLQLEIVQKESQASAFEAFVEHLKKLAPDFATEGWLPDKESPGSGSRKMFEWIVELAESAAERRRSGVPMFDREDDDTVH